MGLFDRLRPPVTSVTIVLNMPIQPMHSGDWYEDPLHELCKRFGRGNRIVGTGTALDDNHAPLRREIDLELTDPVDEHVDAITDLLIAQCAPTGSSVRALGRADRSFGECEVLAIRLPQECPADVMFEHVHCTEAAMRFMERLLAIHDGVFVVQTWHTDDDLGTTVFVSTVEPDRAIAMIEPLLADDPVGRGATIVLTER